MTTVNVNAAVTYEGKVGEVIGVTETFAVIGFRYGSVEEVKHGEYKVIENYQTMYEREKEQADKYKGMWNTLLSEVLERMDEYVLSDRYKYLFFRTLHDKMKNMEQENNL